MGVVVVVEEIRNVNNVESVDVVDMVNVALASTILRETEFIFVVDFCGMKIMH